MMRERFRRRRDAVCRRLAGLPGLACTRPKGGMFVMLDVRRTGLSADAFARRLLADEAVSVLSGEAFGGAAGGHVRLSLTAPDEQLAEACNRIGRFAFRLAGVRAASCRPQSVLKAPRKENWRPHLDAAAKCPANQAGESPQKPAGREHRREG